MIRILLAPLVFALIAAAPAPLPRAVIADPPRDAQNPAHNRQLLVPSHGVGMNALLFAASGKGPKPTLILMHGLPGNERNLDLAQAVRRAGWHVLTFTYRGAWGSPGDFSIGNTVEDAAAALAFARSPEGAKLGFDSRRIVIGGHSMGAMAATLTAASHASQIAGLVMLDAWNPGEDARALSSGGAKAREQAIADMDDLGNALHGATAESLADEIAASGEILELTAVAPRLRGLRVLNVSARFGGAETNRALVAAWRKAGNARIRYIEMSTDHGFNDHRIALAGAVVTWLQQLPPAR